MPCSDDINHLKDLISFLEDKDEESSATQNVEDISPTIPITVQEQLSYHNLQCVDENFFGRTLTAPPPISPPPLISIRTKKPFTEFTIKSGKMFSYETPRKKDHVASNHTNSSYPLWEPIFQSKSCESLVQTTNTNTAVQHFETKLPCKEFFSITQASSTLIANSPANGTETPITNLTLNNGFSSAFYQPSSSAVLPDRFRTYDSLPNHTSSYAPIMQPLIWHKPLALPVTSKIATMTTNSLPVNPISSHLSTLIPGPNLCTKPNTSAVKNVTSERNLCQSLKSTSTEECRSQFKYVKTRHLGEIKLKLPCNTDKDWLTIFYRSQEHNLWCETTKPRRGLRSGRSNSKLKAINYECLLCDDVLSCLKTLMSHMNLHLNLSPYVCNICNKSYASKPSLNRHVRFIHGSIKCVPIHSSK